MVLHKSHCQALPWMNSLFRGSSTNLRRKALLSAMIENERFGSFVTLNLTF